MPLNNKPIHEWNSILIDTGIILSLFAAQNGSTDPDVLFVYKLINFLCKNRTEQGNRKIYISTITLSELLTKENDSEKIKRILRALDSNNVEFLSYDVNTALEFNIRLQHLIDSNKLHGVAKDLGFKTNEYAMGRQWIYADYMIGMTAFANKLDVIITLDKKTFYPVCKDFIGTDCILAYKELFESTDAFILKYDYGNADNFSKNKPLVTTTSTKTLYKIPRLVIDKPTDIFGNLLP